MSDDSTIRVWARFETRAAADLAVEHLVQQLGLARPDIFLQSATEQNTAGLEPSGGDVSGRARARTDSPLKGQVVLSADIDDGQISEVQQMLDESGALEVSLDRTSDK